MIQYLRSLLFLMLLFSPSIVLAEDPNQNIEDTSTEADATPDIDEVITTIQQTGVQGQNTELQSIALSETMARITGTAIHPIFGLACMSLWDDLHGSTKWYATPFLYVPLLLLLFLDICKNTFGLALGPLKKAFDVAFQVIDFANANLGMILAAGFAMESMQPKLGSFAYNLYSMVVPVAHAAEPGTLVYSGSLLLSILAGFCGIALYLVMWVSTQAFSFLIFLCPIPLIDLWLKVCQKTFVTILFVSSLLFPPLAVILCILYFLISVWMFRLSLRLVIFGYTMMIHMIFKNGKGHIDADKGILCFAGSGIPKVKRWTRGYLRKKGDGWTFEYYPYFFRTKQENLTLPDLYLVEGSLYPILDQKSNGWGTTWFAFTPAFNSKEAELATLFNATQGESIVLTGWRNSILFIKQQLFGRPVEVDTPTTT